MCCRYWMEESPELRPIVEEMKRSTLIRKWLQTTGIKSEGEIRFIHDRMPLIIPERLVNEWIRPDTKPEDLMGEALTDMMYEKVAG